ncbi:hypothetical protein Tco_0025585 [Tanacetum coccineum]
MFRCHPDLGVLQIGIRAKVIENQQSCLLHQKQLPTLPSTPTLSQAKSSREPMRRYLMELEEQAITFLIDSPTTESPRLLWSRDPEEDQGGTKPVIPPPSTDITTTGARITGPASGFHILLPEERERLARCMTPSTHSSPPPVPLPLLPSSGCPTQIQTLKIASYTLALDDAYEVGESSTARPTRGQRVDYGFVSTLDAEERRQGIRDVGYGIRDTWVDPAESVLEIALMDRRDEVNT